MIVHRYPLRRARELRGTLTSTGLVVIAVHDVTKAGPSTTGPLALPVAELPELRALVAALEREVAAAARSTEATA